MSRWIIEQTATAVVLFDGEATDRGDALNRMAQDAGYADFASCSEHEGDGGDTLLVYKWEPYELTFVGGASVYARGILGKYEREYDDLEGAVEAAHDLLERFDADGTRAAHHAIVYGYGCGRDGYPVR